MKYIPGDFSEIYRQWVKDNDIKDLTGNQVEFAQWCLDRVDMIRKMGDMESVFKKIRRPPGLPKIRS